MPQKLKPIEEVIANVLARPSGKPSANERDKLEPEPLALARRYACPRLGPAGIDP